jgi:hypothetical protein
VAKRSPILGYNHNVRYRGLVFHVQTEDSGVLSPHLFTHLFHGGVIVSTRKLVYDAGANEEAIKALMQAQHKAVMKDLRRGNFDDKIDQYLGGTPGLEPRETAAVAVAKPGPDPERPTPHPVPEAVPQAVAAQPTVPEPAPPPPEPQIPPASELVIPIEPRIPTPPQVVFKTPRTATADRARAVAMPPPPPPVLEDAPTLVGSAAHQVASAVQAAVQPIVIQRRAPAPPQASPVIEAPPAAQPRSSLPQDFQLDSSPEIQIFGDDGSAHVRVARDTDVEMIDATVPNALPEAMRRQDSAPMSTRRSPTDRPASHVGATLPPARPPQRPAFTPPQVIARPVPPQDGRARDNDAVEIYAPAVPSTEPPPGERAERPGQYASHRGGKRPTDHDQALMREDTGRIPAARNPQDRAVTPTPVRPQPVVPPQPQPRGQQAVRPPPQPPPRGQQTPSGGAPKASNRPQGAPPQGQGRPASGNVVMTRPAVVVGAPHKPATRVRKAREDEGRGFGSGLISEKSLDEVILAYLSEDSEEK